VARLDAIYLGPGEVPVAADLRMDPELTGDDVAVALGRSATTPRGAGPGQSRVLLH
jgi:hypothetical protein